MRKVNDYSLPFGGASKKSEIFPDGVKVKEYESAEGAGMIMDYPDTEDKILRDQKGGVAKAKSRKMKPGYRY